MLADRCGEAARQEKTEHKVSRCHIMMMFVMRIVTEIMINDHQHDHCDHYNLDQICVETADASISSQHQHLLRGSELCRSVTKVASMTMTMTHAIQQCGTAELCSCYIIINSSFP